MDDHITLVEDKRLIKIIRDLIPKEERTRRDYEKENIREGEAYKSS